MNLVLFNVLINKVIHRNCEWNLEDEIAKTLTDKFAYFTLSINPNLNTGNKKVL